MRFVAAAVLALPVVVAAQTRGELWEITMNIPGMPAGMMQPQRVCQGDDPSRAATQDPGKKDCKVTSSKKTATGTSVALSCPDGSTMTIEQQYNAARTEFKSAMTSKGGRQGDFTMNMTGRKVGACDAVAERKAQEAKIEGAKKQAAAGMAASTAAMKDANDNQIRQCSAYLDKMQHLHLSNYYRCHTNKDEKQCQSLAQAYPEATKACTANAVEFCRRLQTPEGFLRTSAKEDAAKMCGVSTASIVATQCPRVAKTQSPLVFLGAHCPVEAKPIAEVHCAGRDYTSRNGGRYARFCEAYLANNEFERQRGQSRSSSEQPKSQGEKAADQVQQGVSKGIDRLRGLFGR
jgi:hypothetical protein